MNYPFFDKSLLNLLNELQIEFEYMEHKPLYTMSDDKDLQALIKGIIPKNLVLKHKNGLQVLVSLSGAKSLNTKLIAQRLGIPNRFSFVTSQQLEEILQITPGSVSIYSYINKTQPVTVILDKEIWDSEYLSFHPNHNQATITTSKAGFERYWNWINDEKYIIQL
jgi:Ala-tRNA(Pro) deacylase